jgi:hypothetical protein
MLKRAVVERREMVTPEIAAKDVKSKIQAS